MAIEIYEAFAVIIIFSRLILIQFRQKKRDAALFTSLLTIAITGVIIIRIVDGNIKSDSLQLALMVLAGLILWVEAFSDNDY